MERRLTLFPIPGSDEESFRKNGARLANRLECAPDGNLVNYLSLHGGAPMIKTEPFPGGCNPIAVHRLEGKTGYFLAREFLAKCLTLAPKREWDYAVAAMINQLPPETVVVYEAYFANAEP